MSTTEQTIAILGIDPGLATMGIVRLELRLDGTEVVDGLEVIHTEKSSRKGEVLATEDNLRRLQVVGEGLARWITDDVIALCAESQSWPRNAGASAKVGMAWGVLGEAARRHGLPILQASPQEVKLCVCGAKDASKEDVQRAMERRYPVRPPWPKQKTLVEHVADALAVAVTCLGHSTVQMARRLRRVA